MLQRQDIIRPLVIYWAIKFHYGKLCDDTGAQSYSDLLRVSTADSIQSRIRLVLSIATPTSYTYVQDQWN